METIYVKKDIEGYYATFKNELDPKLYDNIGKTYEDFLKGKWVKLLPGHLKFKKDFPNASIEEILNLRIDKSREAFTLEEARQRKIDEVLKYDESPDINVFFVNEMPSWFDKIKRNSLMNRFNAEKHGGKVNTSLWIGDQHITLPIESAYEIVYAIENYASMCYDNTYTHIFNIKKSTDQKYIENYNYKTGYPDKLNFNICLG